MKPTRVELERADIYADESKQLLIDRASATLERAYRKAVKAWLADARHYFPTGRGQRWNLKHIRTNQVPIRHATEQLAEQVAGIYTQVARQARRLAFAKAFRVSSGLQDELLGRTPDVRVALAKVAKMTEAERFRDITLADMRNPELFTRVTEGGPAELDTSQRRVARTLVINGADIYVLVWPNGTVQLPGGKVEEGETPEQGAIRETKEEAGIDVEITSLLCEIADKWARRSYYLAAVVPKLQESEFDPSKHPREPAGSPSGGEFMASTGNDAADLAAGRHVGMSRDLVNGLDGGIGPSIQFHGTATATLKSFTSDTPVYIQDNPEEARGYARGMHLGGSTGGEPRVLPVRRAPGQTKNIDNEVLDTIMNGDESDMLKSFARAKSEGFRYVFFHHPSFGGGEDQKVLVSLHPSRDLRIVGAGRRVRQQESLHIDPDGNLLVDVVSTPPEHAVTILTSPFDRAAVGTYLENRSSMHESEFDPAKHHRVPAGSPEGGEFGSQLIVNPDGSMILDDTEDYTYAQPAPSAPREKEESKATEDPQ